MLFKQSIYVPDDEMSQLVCLDFASAQSCQCLQLSLQVVFALIDHLFEFWQDLGNLFLKNVPSSQVLSAHLIFVVLRNIIQRMFLVFNP